MMLFMVLGTSIFISSCSKDDDDKVDELTKETNSLIGTLWSDKDPTEEWTVEFYSAKKCKFSIISVKYGDKDTFECNYTYSKEANKVSWTWHDGDLNVIFNGQIDGEDGIVMRTKSIWNGEEENGTRIFYKISSK